MHTLRTLAAAIAVAILAALPAAAFDASKAPRYPSPDLYRPHADTITIHGDGSTGPIGGMSASPNPFALPGTIDYILGHTGGASPNYWTNPSGAFGDGSPKVVYNDVLSVFVADNWQLQNGTLTPHVTGQTVTAASGSTAVRMLNGFAASGPQSIGTGTKTFTVAAGLNFAVSMPVQVVVADDLKTSMSGTITGYSGTTLTLNITSVTGSGTYSNWVVGRNGATFKTEFKVVTTAASPIGSYTLTVADTSKVDIGSPFQYQYDINFNSISGIQRGAYVVSKTANTITMNLPVVQNTQAATGVGVASGQTIPMHGDVGVFAFQDFKAMDTAGFKFGTSEARDVYVSFKFNTNITGTAAVLMLGYNSGSTLGRTYSQSFSVVPGMNNVTLKIKGDKGGLDTGTWKVGYNTGVANDVWAALGFALASHGTATSQNIPDGVWGNSAGPGDPFFATAGSANQTFHLTDIVGAYADISEVNVTLDKPTPYTAPIVTQTYPSPRIPILARINPALEWYAYGNPTDKKRWAQYPGTDGCMRLTSINDAQTASATAWTACQDNTVYLNGYGAGTLSTDATGKIGSTPHEFQDYTPPVVNSAGGATFGTKRGHVRVVGKTMFVHLELPVVNPGSNTGVIIANLPTACNDRAWYWNGGDSSAGNGSALVGFVPPNSSAMQIRRGDGAFPAVAGSTLNLNGWCELP